MARRIVSRADECAICMSTGGDTTRQQAFVRGYILGKHVICRGEQANTIMCPECTSLITEAEIAYVSLGIEGEEASRPAGRTTGIRVKPVSIKSPAQEAHDAPTMRSTVQSKTRH